MRYHYLAELGFTSSQLSYCCLKIAFSQPDASVVSLFSSCLSAETKPFAVRLSFLFLVQSSGFANYRDQSLGVDCDKFREFRLIHVGGGAAGLLENPGYLRVRHHLPHGVAQSCDDRRGRARRREQACPNVIVDGRNAQAAVETAPGPMGRANCNAQDR